jgi:methylated-DNA-[protein]-cysteine S-methyltransferase
MPSILELKDVKAQVTAQLTRYAVPLWGEGELWMEGAVVLAHDFAFGAANGASEVSVGSELVARLRAFFAGEPVSFEDVSLDLGSFTPFQRSVAETLRGVPRGEVVTYGELAALAGYPNAHRAVGTFCARNRFMIFLPCHRVVAADGIGPYGSAGSATKRRLLALEDVSL